MIKVKIPFSDKIRKSFYGKFRAGLRISCQTPINFNRPRQEFYGFFHRYSFLICLFFYISGQMRSRTLLQNEKNGNGLRGRCGSCFRDGASMGKKVFKTLEVNPTQRQEFLVNLAKICFSTLKLSGI